MENNNSTDQPGWDLLAKYLNRETSVQETKLVEEWANQSDENQKELEKTRQVFKLADLVYSGKKFKSGKAWEHVDKKTQPRSRISGKTRKLKTNYSTQLFKYAAAVLIAVLLGFLGYYIGFRNPVHEIYSEVISPEKLVVEEYTLPDGTVVALNSNSKIEFPKKFKGTTRQVTITGEAFFDVKPDPEKPFLINAGGAQVKVLGTSFNISAYPKNKNVEVVVETGSVQVLRKSHTSGVQMDEVLLLPGEKGILSKTDNKLKKSKNTNRNYLAWKTHNLIFERTPLKEVIEHLKKVYHIEIELENKELNNLLLTAEFNQKPIGFVLNVVQLTFNLNLTMENGHYLLSEKENNKHKKFLSHENN